MQTQTANNAKNFITKLTKEETAAALESGADVADFAVGVRASAAVPDDRPDDRPLDFSAALLLGRVQVVHLTGIFMTLSSLALCLGYGCAVV